MDRIQLRRDTSARWAEINPILLEGEVGYEIDTKLRKIGDGVNRWNDLEYLRAEGISQETGNSQNITMSQDAITRELSELGSEVSEAKNDSFNQDRGEWIYRRKDVHPIFENVILEYLGKTECTIKINGAPNNFNVVAVNKGTGNRMRLSSITSEISMPYSFANPRPDLELVNLQIENISTTDTTKLYDIEISKDNPFERIDERLGEFASSLNTQKENLENNIANVSNDLFNYDQTDIVEYEKEVTVKPSEAAVVLEYLGKTDCTFVIDGTHNNCFLTGINKSTGNEMHLIDITSEDTFPMEIANPRPDLELTHIRVLGKSTALEAALKVTIKKENSLKKSISEANEKVDGVADKIHNITDDLFNYDNIGEAVISKDIMVKPSAMFTVLEYLGKTNCTFVINGVPNKGTIVGTNKATGNQMHLVNITTDTAFPLVVDNPRPDLELINVGFLSSSTSTSAPLNFTIKKQSNVYSDLDDIHKNIFNYDKSRDIVLTKEITVKPSASISVVDYIGRTDCEIVIDGVPNNFILRAWVNELEKVVELGRYTTDDMMPIVINNPRYYQDLGELSVYGFSTAIEANLSITIRKKNAILSKIKQIPLVKFKFDHELKDMSEIVAMFNPLELDETSQWRTMPNQLYNAFDSLVNQYPSYVSRVDIVGDMGMSYPSYAMLGGSATSEYAATPTYKTYMYKLSCTEDSANGSEQTAKLKVLIVAGVHGNEIFAPMNVYHYAKALCECSDANFFKMRGAFDFYIIPCVNTYGMYHYGQNMIHDARCNANDVNLNRNFPIKNWVVSGEGTQNYTGSSAGSEFETQLIMNVLQSVQPSLYIDHHNYGAESQMQYFCTVNEEDYLRLNYQSYIDCNIAFVKGLPEYFGTAFSQVKASGLVGISPSTSGTTNRWCFENGLADFSATLEICNVIKYKNGAILDKYVGEDLYGADALSVGEYTLRNIIMRFCQYVMEVLSNKNGYILK